LARAQRGAGGGSAPADLRRLRKRDFEGAIVAVDFYQRTSVLDVAKKLNSDDR
jgi:hypothetical protein